MTWFGRKRRTRPAPEESAFDAELALQRFALAESVEARAAALRPQMLTLEYDDWLATYLHNAAASGLVEHATTLEHWRFLLADLREGASDDPLTELDLDFPPVWQLRLAELAAFEADSVAAVAEHVVERVEQWLSEPDVVQLSGYQRSRLEAWVAEAWTSVGLAQAGTEGLDAALAHYESALSHSPALECLWSTLFGAAAMVQNKRYDKSHSLRDLDLTLMNAEQAIAAALPRQLGMGDYHAVWAAGLRNTGELTGDALYWSAAASAYSQAAAMMLPGDRRGAAYTAASGTCSLNASRSVLLRDLPYGLRGSTIVELERQALRDPEQRPLITIIPKDVRELPVDELPDDLDKTIQATARQHRAQPAGSAAAAGVALTLAQLVLQRYRSAGAEDDLRSASRWSREALDILRGRDRVPAYRVRAEVLELEDERGTELEGILVEGMRAARAHPSLAGLSLARRCAEHVADKQDWHRAAEAYEAAARIHADLVQRQVGRNYQEMLLGLGPALSSLAAVAHVRAGEPARAAAVLEYGRAQLLSTTLRRDAADLDRVRTLGAEGLADQYVSALLRLDGAHRREDPDVAMAEAQRDLDAAVAAIRELEGMSAFLTSLDVAQMCAVAKRADVTVVFVVESHHGGAVLTVGDEIRAVLLPELGHDAVRARATKAVAGLGRTAHARSVDEACRWLGTVLGPAVRLVGQSQVVLVPCGLLAALPVHAAWTIDEAGQRSYLFDDVVVRHSANVQVLLASLELVRAPSRWRTALVLCDPADDGQQPLPLACVEAGLAEAALVERGVTVLSVSGARASADAVLEALAVHDVVHLACHAAAHDDDPASSGVVLAAGRRLTVSELLNAEIGSTLVVLSACESGAVGHVLPDEVVSLPSALLAAGCGAVVGSLWKVDDQAAALTMMGFYDGVRQGLPPALALHRACTRLRDSTNRELLAWLRELGAHEREDARVLIRQMSLAEPDAHDFASAARWAAFQYVGV